MRELGGGGKLIFHRRKKELLFEFFLLMFMYISGVIDKTFKLSADKQAMDGNELAYLDIFHCFFLYLSGKNSMTLSMDIGNVSDNSC